MNTIDAATGKWHGILKTLGVDESFLGKKHCPCPLCGGTDRYRFDDKDGSGSYICSACGAGYGIDLLMKYKGWDFKTAAREIDQIIGTVKSQPIKTDDYAKNLQRIKWILGSLGDMSSINPVRLYLRNRGLPGCPKLAYHPEIKYFDNGKLLGSYPAMVAKFTLPDGEGSTLHITHLTAKGEKADVPSAKKFLPVAKPMQGGAIRLTDVYSHLGLAEGIETALAVMRDFEIPCWATGTAGMMAAFIPPAGVNHVSIFADNDTNYTGQKAAYTLANRLALSGYRVDVKIPESANTDFADRGTA
jgi:putative DNA primase/helicase